MEGSSGTDRPLCDDKRKGKKKDDPTSNPSDEGIVPHCQVDPEPEAEWDSNASTLNNDHDEAAERKQCWSGGLENSDARKAAKAERKVAKHQVLFDVITQEELTKVEEVLHPQSDDQASAVPNGQGLADNQTIDENIVFNPNTFRWGKLRQRVHAKKIAKVNGGRPKSTPEQDNKILSPIFAQLGIRTNISKANRERKSLDTKLRAAILRDLAAFENDQVETMQRMAGYWRYANRKTYNAMVRNNELWDWATGEKLPEITEEAELDTIEEDTENAEAGSEAVGMVTRVPENWDDPDFGLPTGVAALSLVPLVDGSSNRRKVSGSDTELDGKVEWTEDRITGSKLTSSPDCLPGQTLSINILLPLSDERLGAKPRDHTKENPVTFNGSSTPRDPLSPTTFNTKGSHDKGFQGLKDTRVFGKAIRNASPPPPTDSPRAAQPIRSLLQPAAPKRDNRDNLLRNRFGALAHEVPAPCEEVKKVDDPIPIITKSVVRIPAKPIVKTSSMHDEQEDNWTSVLPRQKGKRIGTKGRHAVALREQAAVNLHARKFAGGKSFAAVVKRGV